MAIIKLFFALLLFSTSTTVLAKAKQIEWDILRTLEVPGGNQNQFMGFGGGHSQLPETNEKKVEKKKVDKKKKAEKKKPKKPLKPSKELKAVLGKPVKLKGFMMPMDYSAKKIVEFLLMPYIPSCMHIPPPPSNQIILVKMKGGSKIAPSYYPVEVQGVIGIEENKEFESTYKMVATKVKEIKE